MLGKLIKLDITFGLKRFGVLAASVIAGGVLIRLLWDHEYIAGSLLLLLGFIVIGILSIYTCVQYYKSNLFESEGYLMFTLPVKTWEILFSKFIITILWFNIMLLATGLAVVIIAQYSVKDIFDILFSGKGGLEVVALLMLEGNSIGIPLIASVYLGVSTKNITINNKPLSGIVSTVITVLASWISLRAIIWASTDIYEQSSFYADLFSAYEANSFYINWMPSLISFAVAIIFTGLYFFIINYIIKKHLNLK